jgi:hypothetical protein
MIRADDIRIEADEQGFELHLFVDDWPTMNEEGCIRVNIHAVADDLYREVAKVIGPWMMEMHAAKREYDSGIADDPSQQAVLDRIKGVDQEDESEDWTRTAR